MTTDAKLQAIRNWNLSSPSGMDSGKDSPGTTNSKTNRTISKNSGTTLGNPNIIGKRAQWLSLEAQTPSIQS